MYFKNNAVLENDSSTRVFRTRDLVIYLPGKYNII